VLKAGSAQRKKEPDRETPQTDSLL